MPGSAQASVRRSIAGLYALTPDWSDTEVMTACVGAAIDGGAVAIQYRNKAATAELRAHQAFALRVLCAKRDATLIINDDVDLADAVGADGVHLGRDDVTVGEARERLGPSALVGASCYDSLEIAERAVDAGADYVAFGSFYPSNTKPGAVRAPLSLLATARARWTIPLVAIGGITPANGRSLVAAGADALAVVSALFDADDVAAAARAFAALFDKRR
jgi:thiamine-phosphate pyrophosphorylase